MISLGPAFRRPPHQSDRVRFSGTLLDARHTPPPLKLDEMGVRICTSLSQQSLTSRRQTCRVQETVGANLAFCVAPSRTPARLRNYNTRTHCDWLNEDSSPVDTASSREAAAVDSDA